jgi:hypothetical protein
MHGSKSAFISLEKLSRKGFPMPIADHFARRADAGFVRAYDRSAARRQLQVSLALVLVLGLAAAAVALLTPLDRPEAAARPQASAAAPLRGTDIFPDVRG